MSSFLPSNKEVFDALYTGDFATYFELVGPVVGGVFAFFLAVLGLGVGSSILGPTLSSMGMM